jgi:hypothetical protein
MTGNKGATGDKGTTGDKGALGETFIIHIPYYHTVIE